MDPEEQAMDEVLAEIHGEMDERVRRRIAGARAKPPSSANPEDSTIDDVQLEKFFEESAKG